MTDTKNEIESEGERTDSAKMDGGADVESTVGRRELLAASGSLSAALAGCVDSGPGGGGGGGGGNDGGGSGDNGSSGSNGSASSGQYPDYSGGTISVATWAGIYAEAFEESVAKSFEERTGATVEVVPAGGSILSKIKSAPKDDPPFDLAAAEGFFYWQGRNENLFLETRDENIPNLQQVYPYLKEFRGTKYGAPTDGSLNGILYRTDLGWEPSTWMDLLADKKGTDRIGFEGS